jgi:polysaccharide deacetylase 2 family uncharacterized protein YibQ
LLLCFAATTDAGLTTARIAIIIDDLGYQLKAGRRALSLPGEVSFAFLPGAPQARRLAKLAFSDGKEVLLHMPLQAAADAHASEEANEPIEIRLDMTRNQVRGALQSALQSVPYAAGINSHRGSLLTQHPGHMQWLMEAIRERDGLYFVDSYTTHKSVALQIAAELNVAAIRRDVFLDPDRSEATIDREFSRLIKIAKQRGTAVAIGHPYETTLTFLEQAIPQLAGHDIELVSVGELAR